VDEIHGLPRLTCRLIAFRILATAALCMVATAFGSLINLSTTEINQSINQSINRSINQSIVSKNKDE